MVRYSRDKPHVVKTVFVLFKMLKPLWTLISLVLLLLGSAVESKAELRKKITGKDEHQVRKHAFQQEMNYPVGPMECSQRCSQWWAKD
jgi:hypothetical protein